MSDTNRIQEFRDKFEQVYGAEKGHPRNFQKAVDRQVFQVLDEAVSEGIVEGHEKGAALVRLLNRKLYRLCIAQAAIEDWKTLQEAEGKEKPPPRVVTAQDVVRALKKRPELMEDVCDLLIEERSAQLRKESTEMEQDLLDAVFGDL